MKPLYPCLSAIDSLCPWKLLDLFSGMIYYLRPYTVWNVIYISVFNWETSVDIVETYFLWIASCSIDPSFCIASAISELSRARSCWGCLPCTVSVSGHELSDVGTELERGRISEFEENAGVGEKRLWKFLLMWV